MRHVGPQKISWKAHALVHIYGMSLHVRIWQDKGAGC